MPIASAGTPTSAACGIMLQVSAEIIMHCKHPIPTGERFISTCNLHTQNGLHGSPPVMCVVACMRAGVLLHCATSSDDAHWQITLSDLYYHTVHKHILMHGRLCAVTILFGCLCRKNKFSSCAAVAYSSYCYGMAAALCPMHGCLQAWNTVGNSTPAASTHTA